MPVIELHLIEGYDSEAKTRLGQALTDAVRLVIPAAPEACTVMIHEMAADTYMRGRAARQPAPALPDPAGVVQAYLAEMEARDLETAQGYLGEGFDMTFPGTCPMTTLAELIAWAKPRYKWVKKHYDGVEAFQSAGETAVVYSRGTLYGEWPDGIAFEGIRFIDRFELSGGKIVRQEVWNDLAEVKSRV